MEQAFSYFITEGYCYDDQYPLVSIGTTEVQCRRTDRVAYDKGYVGNYYYISGAYEDVRVWYHVVIVTAQSWMRELMTSGSAYVSFDVYSSFDAYAGGVYIKPSDDTTYRGGMMMPS